MIGLAESAEAYIQQKQRRDVNAGGDYSSRRKRSHEDDIRRRLKQQ